MSFFYQKIAYLSLYEEDQRIKNIGFVKIRADDNTCKVEIQINGLFSTDTFVCDMYCGETDGKLDELSVKNGKAYYTQTFAIQKIGQSKISFNQFKSIRIQFPGGKRGIAVWEKEMHAAQTPEKVDSPEREYKAGLFMMRNKQKKESNRTKTKGDDQVRAEDINRARAEDFTQVRPEDFSRVRVEGITQVRTEDFNRGNAEGITQVRTEGYNRTRAEDVTQVRAEDFNPARTEDVTKVRTEGYNRTRAEDVTQVRAEDFNPARTEDVTQVRTEGYNRTRTEDVTQVRAEGYNRTRAEDFNRARTEGYNRSGAEGYNQVRAEGYNQVRAEGYNQVRAEGYNQVRAEGYTQARTEENDKKETEEFSKSKIEEINNVKTEKWENQRFETNSINRGSENTIPIPHTYHNKWQQLQQLYPNIMPFQKQQEGEYISIAPKDFVILNEIHQHLVNNSFLLHGYYNYRHLLLGKRIEREKDIYYIGVPGNFYKREKMVAVMFGFEAFEPTNQEEEEEVTQGTFGYYMKEVTI